MYYYGKRGCGWGYTDYPFMSCLKCGYIGCGSKEELEKAKKEGKLIKWTQKRPENIPADEIKDWCIPEPDEQDFWDEQESFLESWEGNDNDWDHY